MEDLKIALRILVLVIMVGALVVQARNIIKDEQISESRLLWLALVVDAIWHLLK